MWVHLIGGQGCVTFVGLLTECESGCLWVGGTDECLLVAIDTDVDCLILIGIDVVICIGISRN